MMFAIALAGNSSQCLSIAKTDNRSAKVQSSGQVAVPGTPSSSAIPKWQKEAGAKMNFSVASVKQNTTDPSKARPHSNFPLGNGNAYSATGGFFDVTNFPLFNYIMFAYKVDGSQWESLRSHLPKWVISDRFDIEARGPVGATKDQMRLMLQSLLEDRFKLTTHYETRDLPVFKIVLAKSGKTGPRLQPHSSASPCPSTNVPGRTPGVPATVQGDYPAVCGAVIGWVSPEAPGRWRWGGRNVPMDAILEQFTGALDRPVVDQTGLSGTFDFFLEFTPDEPASPDFKPDPTGPTFVEAVRDQLGLKLEPQVAPVDVFVVDHVEHPSPN
jgi:uncharacterized protein (TIGR03435 family)